MPSNRCRQGDIPGEDSTAAFGSDLLNRPITFFDDRGGGTPTDALEPIASEMERRGYEVRFSSDITEPAGIGFYAEHIEATPEVNADLSLITFHGIDDVYDTDFWIHEPWGMFDIGLLPGTVAAENWQRMSWLDVVPQLGVFEVGWPKSDRVFSDEFRYRVRRRKQEFGIETGTTVIYAPTVENDDKMHRFVEAAKDVFDNLLVKHAPYDDVDYGELNAGDETVHVIEKDADIMEALGMADVLVSDQSSVLVEALLTETIPVSVSDWPIRRGRNPEFPGKSVPEFVTTTTDDSLTDSLAATVNELGERQRQLETQQQRNFSNMGQSAATTVNLLEGVVEGDRQPQSPVPCDRSKWQGTRPHRIYYRNRQRLVNSDPIKQHKIILKRLGIDKPLLWMDDKFSF